MRYISMFTNCICKYTFFTSLLNLYQVLIYLNFTAVPHGRLEPTRTRVPFRTTTRSAIILDTYTWRDWTILAKLITATTCIRRLSPCGFHIRSCVEFVNQIMCAGSRGSLYSSKLPSWIISSLNKGFVYGTREFEQIIFARSIIYLLKVVFFFKKKKRI